MRRTLIPLLLALVFAPRSLAQSTWYVDQSGGGDFTGIQQAISSPIVQSGDLVLVRPGTYPEALQLVEKALHIKSTSGPSNTLIHNPYPGSGHYAIYGSSISATSILEGFSITSLGNNVVRLISTPFTLRLCQINNHDSSGYAAVQISGASTVLIESCSLNDNIGINNYAGAIQIEGGNVTIVNSEFQNNQSSNGGAIHQIAGTLLISGSDFINNQASNRGGAVKCGSGTTATFLSCRFEGNSATTLDGGAIEHYGGQFVVQLCDFTGNYSGRDGAAIYGYTNSASHSVAIDSCTIRNSSSGKPNGYSLQGIGDHGGSFTVSKTLFLDNLGTSLALFNSRLSADMTVRQCSIIGGSEIGLYLQSSTATDCILRQNFRQAATYGSATITFSNVEGGWQGTGNIDLDPEFIDPLNGDFRLLDSSPCIDSGDPGSPEDPDGTRADMGAYYYDQHPVDGDTDDDGIPDVDEVPLYGTDPREYDTDEDGLPDGLEVGITIPHLDSNLNFFIADEDPGTTTNPLVGDSDGGGVLDGTEDYDHNGAVDTWDTDPNNGADESFVAYFSGIIPGGKVRIEVWGATPFETIIPAYSLKGPGPSPTGLGILVDLSRPITLMDPFLSDAEGRASVDRLPVPNSAPLGLPVWMQVVEVPLSNNLEPRASNSVLITVGAY